EIPLPGQPYILTLMENCTLIAPAQNHRDSEPARTLDFENRINISILFGRYMQAERAYNEAARRFNEACSELRGALGPDRRLVIRYDATHYLLETDAASNFDLEEIQSV